MKFRALLLCCMTFFTHTAYTFHWKNTQEDIDAIPQCTDRNSKICRQINEEINEFKKACTETLAVDDWLCNVKKRGNLLHYAFFHDVAMRSHLATKRLPSEREAILFSILFNPNGAYGHDAANNHVNNFLRQCMTEVRTKRKDSTFKEFLIKKINYYL